MRLYRRDPFADHVVEYGIVASMPEEFDQDADGELSKPPSFFPTDIGKESDVLVEVELQGVFQAMQSNQQQPFLVLSDGERRVDIVVGHFEAHAITRVAEGIIPERPYTHDLLKTVMEKLGAKVHSVVIDDMWNDIYYAKLYLRVDDQEIEIDARPSDAVAMAIRYEAPIYISERLLGA